MASDTTTTVAGPVVLRSADETVVTQVRRLTDLAGLPLAVVPPGAAVRAAAVLLEDDGDALDVQVAPARALAGPDAPARAEGGPDGAGRLAVGADGADRFPTRVRLPAEAATLLDVIVTAGTPYRARTVGVVGAHGGAGASVLAAALARACVAGGAATALVDLDPAGGGLDVLLDLEHDPGQRWADLRAERGALLPDRLAPALPAWHLVRVLSGDGRGGAGGQDLLTRSAVRALGQGHDVVVLDLPRSVLAGAEEAQRWLSWCDEVVLVSTGGVRGRAATVAAGLALTGCSAGLVVRGASPDPAGQAAAGGLELLAHLREERRLNAGTEHGLSPGDQRRGPLWATARALAAGLGLW